MKKLLKISLILMLAMCFMGSVNAKFSGNVNMTVEGNKTEVARGEEVTIVINLANAETYDVVYAMDGKLHFDNTVLTYKSMQKLNGTDVSYNPAQGEGIVLNGDTPTNGSASMCKITFTVNSNAKLGNTQITFTELSAGDGDLTAGPTELTCAPVTLNIVESKQTDPGTSDPGTTDPGTTDPGTTDPGTTKPGTTDPGTTDPGTTKPGTTDPGTTKPGTTDPGTTNPGTTDKGGNTNNKDEYNKGKLPQTGENNTLMIVISVIAVLLAVTIFVRIRKMRVTARRSR